MNRLYILVVVIVLVAGVKSILPQSRGSTSSSSATHQSKADRKAEKATAKAAKKASKARGKKSTSTEDAAYALAYMFGRPKA